MAAAAGNGFVISKNGWDAVNGVWVGDQAAAGDEEVPKPLIIFGYGSLCWRPDGMLEKCNSFPGLVRGWARLFAQKSMDHRGTPDFPGLVVTLAEVEMLKGLPGFDQVRIPEDTLGRAYVVPDADADRLLADLDFREKGGYTRKVVSVERLDGTGSVRALLYSGTVDNPNFWWGEDGLGLDMERAASIISRATGPSGPNLEYLVQISAFLREQGHHDPHVEELCARVKKMDENPGLGHD